MLLLTALTIAIIIGLIAARQADAYDGDQNRARHAICQTFGRYCKQALHVSWCESRYRIWATNGQYLGLFQMGTSERRIYGHGPGAWVQARAARAYFIASGRDWSPWDWRCRP